MSDPAKASSPSAKPPSPPAGSPSSTKSSPPAATVSLPPPAAPIHDNTPLAVDENPEDDPGISVDQESTISITSSILRYRKENGRTYHAYKDGVYAVPNDKCENDRLDLQHILCRGTFDDKLHCAPLPEISLRVLDAGCGTGVWSIEFADVHPNADVNGVDLSPIQPTFVPPNVSFFVDDVEDDWTFSKPFDFVFARFLTGSIEDWPKFFKQTFENLNPGGFIELQDIIFPVKSDDDTLPEHSALRLWSELLAEGFRGIGRPIDTAYNYEGQLAEAGFVNIHVIREKWPVNRWPRDRKYKQLGIWSQENWLSGLSALSLAVFTRPKSENGLGWGREELEVLLADVRTDLKNHRLHAYFQIWVVYAEKPRIS